MTCNTSKFVNRQNKQRITYCIDVLDDMYICRHVMTVYNPQSY